MSIEKNHNVLGKLRLEYLSADQIKTNPLNKKHFSENLKEGYTNQHGNFESSASQLGDSIKTNGIYSPLLLTKDYRIISGHRRYLWACKLNMQKIPCLVAEKEISPEIEELLLIDANIQGRSIRGMDTKQLREKRLELYEKIFSGFRSRVLTKNKDLRITQKDLEDAGVTSQTAKVDLATIRRAETKKINDAVYSAKEVLLPQVNSVKQSLGKIKSVMIVANNATKKEIVKAIKKFYSEVIV